MSDRLEFERRLAQRLRARASIATRPFDAAAIAQEVVRNHGRRRVLGLDWPTPRPASRLLIVGLLLATAALGVVAGVGALLREPALWAPPSVSNGWIAVSANPVGVAGGEMGDIYLLRAPGDERRIIGSAGDGVAQACPSFSTDGRRLAFGEARATGPGGTFRGRWPAADRAVVVVELDDRSEQMEHSVRVPVSREEGEIPCPKWAPDGRHVAFRAGSELWVADTSSGETMVFQLLEVPWGRQAVAWSRDGSRIAVAETGQIRIIPLDGGGPRLIPVGGAAPVSLGWTANDAGITYIATDEPGDGLAVHVVDLDGGNDSRLSPNAAGLQLRFHSAVVSPDGTRLAFAQRTYRCTDDSCHQDPPRLLVMDPDGSNVAELSIPAGFGISGLVWSPDGRRLLLGSIDGVVSVPVVPGASPIVHSDGNLNLEWSGSELDWQASYR